MRYYSANADLPAEGDCSLFIVHSLATPTVSHVFFS